METTARLAAFCLGIALAAGAPAAADPWDEPVFRDDGPDTRSELSHGYDETHAFAEAASKRLEALHSGVVTTEWLKAKRTGVLLDFHQNGMGRTTASVYSVRPKPGATVSVPLRWDELTDDIDRHDFTMAVALRRIEEHGDLFAPVLDGGQTLDQAMATLGASSTA